MADPITLAAVGSAMAAPAAATIPTLAGAGALSAGMGGAAALGGGTLGAMGAGAGALGSMGALSANPLIAAGANGALAGNALLGTEAALAGGSNIVGPMPFVGPPAPTFTQSAMNTLGNVKGLMNQNPALTNLTVNTAREMMQPPPPPQVLQAPPIQSGQFAPVNFANLLNPNPPQLQRRTSLLG
jgi:hypothetical protein